MNKYDLKISFLPGEKFDLDGINAFCSSHPNDRVLIEIPNTKNISPEMIQAIRNNADIRIAGAFDEERLNKNSYYYDSVIYTKNEVRQIITEMQRIEAGINSNWSDIQKAVYIYEKIKSQVMFAPENVNRKRTDTENLTGFISGETRGIGYSVMYKEMLDRQGIKSHYVQGYNDHAWNVLDIDGKMYGVDLAFDNAEYRKGNIDGLPFFARNPARFNRYHTPIENEPLKDYQDKLSEIDPKIVDEIVEPIRRTRDFSNSTVMAARRDGSIFSISQVGSTVVDNKRIFQYVYRELDSNSKYYIPIILYGDSNISQMFNNRKYNDGIDQQLESRTIDILLSKENIANSLNSGSFYLGGIKDSKGNYASNPNQISKPQSISDQFRIAPKQFKRSDGSGFVVQRTSPKAINVKGVPIFSFDIYETVIKNGREVLIKNTVFSERDFLLDSRPEIANRFLSRQRLDRKVNESSGYIGQLNHAGTKIINSNLLSEFDPYKTVDTTEKEPVELPTFAEIKELVKKYESFYERDGDFGGTVSIRDIRTKEKVKDESISSKALLANLWLCAAGSNFTAYDRRPGDFYALNDNCEDVYNKMVEKMTEGVTQYGVINTSEVLRHVYDHSYYKYKDDIIKNIFRSPYQTEFINKLAVASVKDHPYTNEVPQPLWGGDENLAVSFGVDQKK